MRPAGAPRRSRGPLLWWIVLVAAICFEGLGRKFLPFVPAAAFYYLKDAVLIAGLLAFGIRRDVLLAARALFGAYVAALVLGILWTALQMLNPSQPSLVLALIGFRAYWVWWLAPLVVASALRSAEDRRDAVYAMTWVALVVAGFAFVQFAAPAQAEINQYALYQGEQVTSVAIVGTTGRPRVSSTFSYIVGFSNFVVLVAPLLLAAGLGEIRARRRTLTLFSAALVVASAFTTGSRAPVVLAGGALALVAWKAGFLATRLGRRVFTGVAVAAAVAYFALPEAVLGVSSRFSGADTLSRFEEVVRYFPPVALARVTFPLLGVGTGTQQNVRSYFGVDTGYHGESETSRLLVELGAVGYLLVWLLKFGLAHALVRTGRALGRAGNGTLVGLCIAYAGFAVLGNFVFDHVWQALLMICAGLLLRMAIDETGPGVTR